MSDQSEALKPCPFCGGPVQLAEANRTRDYIMGERRWWGVVCRNTTNQGGTCCMDQVPSASKEAAIARWNLRRDSRIEADEALMRAALQALETGHDCAIEVANEVHEKYKGYKPERHAAVDMDVSQIDSAITALRKRLESSK